MGGLRKPVPCKAFVRKPPCPSQQANTQSISSRLPSGAADPTKIRPFPSFPTCGASIIRIPPRFPTRRPAVPYGRATPCFPISNGTANAWPAWPKRWPGGPWKRARPDTQSLWPCPSRRVAARHRQVLYRAVRRQPCPDRRVMGGRFHRQPQGGPSRLPPCRMALAVAGRSRTSDFFRHLCGQAGPPRRNGIARRAL